MNIIGTPVDGSELSIQPLSGAAAGMQFMLRRAEDFAAASKTLVSANVSNKGSADISASVVNSNISSVLLSSDTNIFNPSLLNANALV